MGLLFAVIPGREEAKGLLLTNRVASESFLSDQAHILAAIVLFLVVFVTYSRLRINSVNQYTS